MTDFGLGYAVPETPAEHRRHLKEEREDKRSRSRYELMFASKRRRMRKE